MLRRAAVIAIVLCALATASANAGTSPSLRLLDRSPLTVRGDHFTPRERVRVTATADGKVTRVAMRVSASGTFRAVLETVTVDRCSLVRVVAVGGSGRHAQIKMLPSPMCMPQ